MPARFTATGRARHVEREVAAAVASTREAEAHQRRIPERVRLGQHDCGPRLQGFTETDGCAHVDAEVEVGSHLRGLYAGSGRYWPGRVAHAASAVALSCSPFAKP